MQSAGDGVGPTINMTSPKVNSSTARPMLFTGSATDRDGIRAVYVTAQDLVTKQYWTGSGWSANRREIAMSIRSGQPTTAYFSMTVPPTRNRMYMTARAQDGAWKYGTPWSLQMNNDGGGGSTASTGGSTGGGTSTPAPNPSGPNLSAGTLNLTSPGLVHGGGRLTIAGTAAGTSSGNAAPTQVQVILRDLTTKQFWNGSSWQSAFATANANLSNGGTSSSGAAIVNFNLGVTTPANRMYVGVRTRAANGSYGPLTTVQTSLPSGAPATPTPTTPATTPATAPPATTPSSGGGGQSTSDSDDPTVVRDADKPAIVIVQPATTLHDGGNLRIAGTASDADGIARVQLTVRDLFTKKYWNGSSFTTAFGIVDANVSNPGFSTTDWSIDVPTPAAPLYIAVRGIDSKNTYGDFVPTQTDIAANLGGGNSGGGTTGPVTTTPAAPVVTPTGGSADKGQTALCTGPVRMGVAIDLYAHNPDSAAYSAAYDQLADKTFCHVSSENSLKRSYVQSATGATNYGVADSFVAAAERYGATSRGHSLVWNYRDPAFIGNLNSVALRQDMNDFIRTTMTRYPNIDDWDVVNEPLNWNGRGFWTGVYDALEPNGYPQVRADLTTQAPNYMIEAFRAADRVRRDNGLNTKLWLNESNVLDPNNPKYGAKAESLYNMTKWMVDNGIPIDGVGFQAHLKTSGLTPLTVWGSNYEVPVLNRQTAPAMCANLRRYKSLGLQVALTEADIVIPLNATQAQLNEQIEGYKLLYQLSAEVGVSDLTIWGLSDGHSFYEKLLDGAYVVPGFGQATVFDKQLQAKRVYNELKSFIDSYRSNPPAPIC